MGGTLFFPLLKKSMLLLVYAWDVIAGQSVSFNRPFVAALHSPMENDYQAAQELRWGKYTIYICNDSDALLYEYLHTVLFMTSPVK